jgi:hypothetical protein
MNPPWREFIPACSDTTHEQQWLSRAMPRKPA